MQYFFVCHDDGDVKITLQGLCNLPSLKGRHASWNFGWSVITLGSKKCIRCQGSLQIDGGCVVQDVKERIASRTYTKKKTATGKLKKKQEGYTHQDLLQEKFRVGEEVMMLAPQTRQQITYDPNGEARTR